jgi:ankyrin repeat protein
MLAKLQSQRNNTRLHENLVANIDVLCPKIGAKGIKRPDPESDQLFHPDYQDDGYYGNALQAAVVGGNPKMVQLLLNVGADVNEKSGKFGYALQAAAYTGNKEIVRMLLKHGANIHAQGGRYGSAHRAA